jgi:hypothetical protein
VSLTVPRRCDAGNDRLREGRIDEAVELYTRAIDANPSGSQAHVLFANRAAALTRIGKHAEALEDGRCANVCIKGDGGGAFK